MPYNKYMANKKKYTDNQLIKAVEESTSIAQVIRKIGLLPAGGNFQTVKRKIKELKLDDSHFTGKGWNKGDRYEPIKLPEPLDTILVEDRNFNTYHLKNRLFREGLKIKECEKCKNTHWLDQPIALELEHIDGNRSNNTLENLQILCPNCHAQTSTYRGKNKKS